MNATAVQVRVPPEQLAKLDDWIAKNGEGMSRPEAIRRLVDEALS